MKGNYIKPSRAKKSQLKRHVGRVVGCGVASVMAWVVLGLATPAPTLAAAASSMQFPHAMTPVFRWSDSMQLKLSGMPVVVRKFVATQSLESVAQTMANHREKFQRVTTLPGTILLSGVYNNHHWVAQLEEIQGQVQGMVSTLPLSITSAQPDESRAAHSAPWLTHDAVQVFEHGAVDSKSSVMQSLHVPRGSMDEFLADLNARLSHQGWQRRASHSWERSASTHAKPGRIEAYPVNSASGAAVLVQLSQ